MSYATLRDIRGYLNIDITSDDPLLQEAIESAESYIDSQTNRHFEAATDTRYYDRSARDRWNRRLLNLYGDDLLTITSLTNGDSSATVIAATDYWLYPRNEPPYHGILLQSDISSYWEWDTDYWVTIVGTWGYSATPPDDIRQATLTMAAYLYRSKDAAVFETTAIVESGAIVIPQGVPATVDRIINRYKRRI